MIQHTFQVNQIVYYTAPSWLSRKVIIDDIKDNQAYIWYLLEDGTEMTGWVLLTDLTPLAKTAALVGDVETINEEIALDEEYSEWLTTLDNEANYYEILAGQRLSEHRATYDQHVAQIRAGGVVS